MRTSYRQLARYGSVVVVSCSLLNAQMFKMGLHSLDTQTVTVGLKAGIPQRSPLETTFGNVPSFAHSNYTVGPQVEVRLLGRLAVEADALYTGLPYKTVPALSSQQDATAQSWEFPLLLKAYLGRSKGHRSFVGAGPSFRSISGIKDIVTSKTLGILTRGVSISSGTAFRIGGLSLCPEVRYTYWGPITFGNGIDLVFGNRTSQAQVLFGIVF